MDTLKALFSSKRFLTAMVAILVVVLDAVGLDLPDEAVETVVYLAAALIGGYSLSDAFGKGKVEAQAKLAMDKFASEVKTHAARAKRSK